MRAAKIWENEYAYNRIMDILESYWLTEPDELFVSVQMEFIKANGEHQEKTIRWKNPNYGRIHTDFGLIDGAEIASLGEEYIEVEEKP